MDARVWTLDDVVGVAVAGREIRELIKGKGFHLAVKTEPLLMMYQITKSNKTRC